MVCKNLSFSFFCSFYTQISSYQAVQASEGLEQNYQLVETGSWSIWLHENCMATISADPVPELRSAGTSLHVELASSLPIDYRMSNNVHPGFFTQDLPVTGTRPKIWS